MISDDVLPAAFAVVSSPKRYALLLGSGISRDAGILTGWDITKDRIQKIACGLEGTIPPDPVAWYLEKYGTEPTFSGLFGDQKASQEDQEASLREYFTVNGTAPEPTKAHRTIATMVKEGLIGLIITTNFDDLLERALRDAGVRPVVITEGSDPKKMSVIPDECRIVKVNGDYPSTSLKMTRADLSSYSPEIESYLDRIFSEYGLIICGWSAEDDTRLVEILAEERVRRYSVFWCHLEERAALPEKIVERLEPSTIRITSADELFGELYSRIEVLRRYEHKEKMSVSTAIKRVKDALREEKPELFLPDLINEETDRVLAFLAEKRQYGPKNTNGDVILKQTFKEFEDATAPLAAMVTTVAYYDDKKYLALISDTIERLVNAPPLKIEPTIVDSNNTDIYEELKRGFESLRHYPALLVIYTSGIAAVRQGNFDILEAILNKPKKYRYNGILQNKTHFFEQVNIWDTIGFETKWIGPSCSRERIWIVDDYPNHPYEEMYAIIQSLIPNRYTFYESLDIFEYLFGLAYLVTIKDEDIKYEEYRHSTPSPLQSKDYYLRWNRLLYPTYDPLPHLPSHITTYLGDIQQRSKGSGFFGGDLSLFEEANQKYAKGFGIDPPKTGLMSLTSQRDSNLL